MSSADSGLHALGKPVGPGEIQFVLRGAAAAGEVYGVECVYRPYRERDVKKARHLNLLRGWIGGGSQDLLKVQRDEFHSVRRNHTATGSNLTFSVSLRDPDEEFAAYQLDRVRVVGGRVGTLDFERWFAAMPTLDAGFGLECGATSLRGVLRPSGLGAHPLRGSIPLWPALRAVDLEFVPVEVPGVRLFDAAAKHHWDGWRQTSPQAWPGGRTIVLRHIGSPTVWREHEYHAFPPANEPPGTRPVPPPGVVPGVQVEVFWPEGEALEFPETQFDRDVDVVALPLAKLSPALSALLAESVRLRPGCEPSSVSAPEWKVQRTSIPEMEMPLSLDMTPSAGGGNALKITRRPGFSEPWVCLFVTDYDAGRRFIVSSLLLRPERWTGSLPE